MTRLVSIEVTDLAGRKAPVRFQFNDDINIFFGLNGSGKTSLLRLLFSALQDDVTHIRRTPFTEATVVFTAESEVQEVSRSIRKDSLNSLPPIIPQTIMTAQGLMTLPVPGQRGWHTSGTFSLPVPASYLPTFRLFGDPSTSFWFNSPDASPYSESRLDQQFLQLVTNRWINYSNVLLTQVRTLQDQAIRDLLGSLFSASKKRIRGTTDPSAAYELVNHFLERRGLHSKSAKAEFIKKYSDDPSLQRVVADIAETEQRIIETEQPRQRFEDLIHRFLTTNKHVTFSEQGIRAKAGDEDIGIDLLSSGEKHLVRILLESLSAQGNCIIIDEPELSLHIDWQHELVNAMRTVNPNLQIVMATHSPDIMANVPDNKIFELSSRSRTNG